MKYNEELYPFESKWIEINDDRIHYVDKGQGQIILFSHAAIGSSFMYRRFIQILSRSYRCIALDFPGFGLSQNDPKKDYTIRSQAELLEQFIHCLNLKDIIGLGHDTGGPSLFRVAGKFPHLFSGLILTDTIIFPTKEYKRIHNMLAVVGSAPFLLLNGWTNFMIKLTLNKGVATRSLQKEEKAMYYLVSAGFAKRRRIIQMLTSLRQSQEFMNVVKLGFENHLNSKPTLLIYGEKDPVNVLGIPERIHAMLKNSELFLIKNEGHFPHEGQPERMSEIIDRWIGNRIGN